MSWEYSHYNKIDRILRNDPLFVRIFEDTVGFREYFYNSFNHPHGISEKKSQLLETLRELKKFTNFSFSCLTRYIMTTPTKLIDDDAMDTYMMELALSFAEDDGRGIDAYHRDNEFVVYDIARKILVSNRYDCATFEYFQPEVDLRNMGKPIPFSDVEDVTVHGQKNASSGPYDIEDLVQKANAKYQQVRKEEREWQKLKRKMQRAEKKMQNRFNAEVETEKKKRRKSAYARGKATPERLERKKYEPKTRSEETAAAHGKLIVSFPNGKAICYGSAKVTFHEAIRRIAPQLIGTSIEWRGKPIVTYAVGPKHKHQYSTDGFYIMTPVSIANMCKVLQDVSHELHLDWVITI